VNDFLPGELVKMLLEVRYNAGGKTVYDIAPHYVSCLGTIVAVPCKGSSVLVLQCGTGKLWWVSPSCLKIAE
jgi:hypothetical protein